MCKDQQKGACTGVWSGGVWAEAQYPTYQAVFPLVCGNHDLPLGINSLKSVVLNLSGITDSLGKPMKTRDLLSRKMHRHVKFHRLSFTEASQDSPGVSRSSESGTSLLEVVFVVLHRSAH